MLSRAFTQFFQLTHLSFFIKFFVSRPQTQRGWIEKPTLLARQAQDYGLEIN